MAEQRDRAVFVISVAAEGLVGVHPQTLRIYKREGLVRPKRASSSNARRFSGQDIERLLEIKQAASDGMNLEGVRRVSPAHPGGSSASRPGWPPWRPSCGPRPAAIMLMSWTRSAARPAGTWSPTPRPSSATSTPPPDAHGQA